MNCKQGDMAIIIRSQAGNEGKVVTCMEYVRGPMLYESKGKLCALTAGDWWRTDRNVNMFVEESDGSTVVYQDFAPFVFDKWIRPIGNKDNPEEVKDDVLLPSSVPVNELV